MRKRPGASARGSKRHTLAAFIIEDKTNLSIDNLAGHWNITKAEALDRIVDAYHRSYTRNWSLEERLALTEKLPAKKAIRRRGKPTSAAADPRQISLISDEEK